jgi:hypothetical protein
MSQEQKDWEKWVNEHSVNQEGVYFINSDWVIRKGKEALAEKDNELNVLVDFILSEYLHGELPDEIDKICIGFQQGEWYKKKERECAGKIKNGP